ncbi:MAG: response regulator [Oscillospiraceae bacterium]|jgi:YesN/AraC family two-component response regulator
MFSVYIIDDEPLSVEETALSIPWMDNGMQVIGSQTSPERAVEEIVEKKPDVVFCDLKMPVIDGNRLIRIVKDKGIDCEFIMLSAYDGFSDSREFFRNNGFDYLLKPINLDEMQMVLERLTKKLSEKNPSFDISDEEADAGMSNTFETIENYIRINFQRKITLELLSKSFGISPGYICNLFSGKHNRTLTSFLTELRMTEAANQILNSDKLLKQISISCGYSSYIYFCRVFKEYYGMTPTAYKEQNK